MLNQCPHQLNDGSKVPILGLGVYEMLGAETYNGVMDALKVCE